MPHMTKQLPTKFPRSAEIKRAITAVAKSGVSVGSVEVMPDGGLRIYAAMYLPTDASNDFDVWDQEGAL